jgi:hypothetical protein
MDDHRRTAIGSTRASTPACRPGALSRFTRTWLHFVRLRAAGRLGLGAVHRGHVEPARRQDGAASRCGCARPAA